MNYRSIARNVLYAFNAQGIALFLSAFIVLLVPKYIGAESYGYLQLFLFYSAYAVFFHLGLNDGLYLRTGGASYNEVANGDYSGQFWLSVGYLSVLGASISAAGALLMEPGQRRFVVIVFGLYVILYDLNNFLGTVFQATNRIGDYAFSVSLEKIVVALGVSGALLQGARLSYFYVLSFVIGKAVSLGYCVFVTRDLVFCWPAPLSTVVREALMNIRVGVKLTVANSAGLMVTGVARLAVDSSFGIKAFGQLSLSLSLTNLFLALISQVGMVLFPSLRRAGPDELLAFFRHARVGVGLALPFILLCYAPLSKVLGIWLPQYSQAFTLLGLIMPVCYFDGKVNMLFNTYLKVYRKENVLLTVNLLTVGISGILAFFAASILGNIEMVFVGILISVVVRSFVLEGRVCRLLGVAFGVQILSELSLTGLFVLAVTVLHGRTAFLLTVAGAVAYIVVGRSGYVELARRVLG